MLTLHLYIMIVFRCDNTTDICNLEPCNNGATCEKISSIRRKCICVPGYTGINCETDIGMFPNTSLFHAL